MEPIAIEILDTEGGGAKAEKENEVPILELPAPLMTPLGTEEEAIRVQHAICTGHQSNCHHPYPSITFPTI